jgi:hypothetical protein
MGDFLARYVRLHHRLPPVLIDDARKEKRGPSNINKLVDRHRIENLDVISRRLDSFSKILQARQFLLRNFNRMGADRSSRRRFHDDDC